MEQKKNISDELLARYLCGQVSDSEREEVLAYMGESDENLAELIEISTAIEEQKEREKAAAAPEPQVIKMNPRHRVQTRYIWAAAAVVLIFAVGGAVMWRVSRTPHGGDEVIVASNQGTGAVPGTSTVPGETPQVGTNSGQEQQQGNGGGNAVVKEEGYSMQMDTRNLAGAEEKVEPLDFKMTFPRRQTEVVSSDSQVEFEWQSNATNIVLTVTNEEGEVLLNKEFYGSASYSLNMSRFSGHDQLRWKVDVRGSDGTTTQKSGVIKVME